MLLATDFKVVGTISVRNFLTDFSDFHYKANPHVWEIISNFLKMDMQMIDNKRASIFTYYKAYEDGYKYHELVHWGLIDTKSNVERVTFYVHYEDWDALYCYLSMLNDEYDVKYVKFEIEDGYLIVNDDFKIKLYD